MESCLSLKVLRNAHSQTRNVQTQAKLTVVWFLISHTMYLGYVGLHSVPPPPPPPPPHTHIHTPLGQLFARCIIAECTSYGITCSAHITIIMLNYHKP